VSVSGKQVLHTIDLQVGPGSVHALMGPNGSGKSSLAYTLMGHPKYTITQGSCYFKGSDLCNMPIDERSRNGIFLAMQSPIEIPGLSVYTLLKEAVRARNVEAFSLLEFTQQIEQAADKLLGIWRPCLTELADAPPVDYADGRPPAPITQQLLIAKLLKQRMEAAGHVFALHFAPEYVRLADLELRHDE
jgi:ABC-type uncharacterized transport system ATPase subunit